jgi:hypothetical protein
MCKGPREGSVCNKPCRGLRFKAEGGAKCKNGRCIRDNLFPESKLSDLQKPATMQRMPADVIDPNCRNVWPKQFFILFGVTEK